MIIYRIRGRMEAFKDCGMLGIEPVADSSLTRLKHKITMLIKDAKQRKLAYDFWVEKLTVKLPSVTDMITLFETEDVDRLVTETKRLKRWASIEENPRY